MLYLKGGKKMRWITETIELTGLAGSADHAFLASQGPNRFIRLYNVIIFPTSSMGNRLNDIESVTFYIDERLTAGAGSYLGRTKFLFIINDGIIMPVQKYMPIDFPPDQQGIISTYYTQSDNKDYRYIANIYFDVLDISLLQSKVV